MSSDRDISVMDAQSEVEVTAKVNSDKIVKEWEDRAVRARGIIVQSTFGARTDLGRIRENNEDKFEFFIPEDEDTLASKGSLYAVADGMGGHSAGQIASELALKTLVGCYYSDDSPMIEESLRAAVRTANGIVYDVSRAVKERQGMGTTLTVLIVRGDEGFVAHVGDSRCYRVRDGQIAQVSEDHSWVQEQVRLGGITLEEAMMSPYRNIITRSIGNTPSVEVDIQSFDIRKGDVFVLCTDGLSGELTDGEILSEVQKSSPSKACLGLVSLALEHGGRDNTTVMIVSVHDILDADKKKRKPFYSFLTGG